MGLEVQGSKFKGSGFKGSEAQSSAQLPAKKTAGLIEKETEVSYDLYGIRLRAQGVCIRFNLILFVLVLEIRIL